MTTKNHKLELPAIVQGDPVGRMLANRGFFVQRVDPQEFTKGVELSENELDEKIVALIERDGFANVQEAFAAVCGTFGIAKFADKDKLAADQSPFYIDQIVQRVSGGFEKADDWALRIALAETGELQTLTLEANPGRDRFLYTMAYAMEKKRIVGDRALAVLDRIDKKNGTHFFLLSPASLSRNNRRFIGETIDQEPIPV